MGVELGVLTAHAQSLTLNFDMTHRMLFTGRHAYEEYMAWPKLCCPLLHEAAVPCLLFVHMQ